MPGSSNTSFIPKHTPNKGERKNSPRQLFIGTLLVRILFFATLISAIGLYFYINKLNNELADAKASFDAVTNTFTDDQDDVDMVVDLDKRLAQANERFRNNVSVNALIVAIEKATLSTVQFTKFELNRKDDSTIELATSLRTDGFDSVIFQRELLRDSDQLKQVEVEDVSIQYDMTEQDSLAVVSDEVKEITFNATIAIDPGTIRSVVITDGILPPPAPEPIIIQPEVLPTEESAVPQEDPSVGVQIISNQENNI